MTNNKTILIGTALALLLILSNGTQTAHAERITIEKPFEPVIIEDGTIPLNTRYRADPLEILCKLEEGRKYHIYLVGEWTTKVNESSAMDRLTDYDIEVFDSQNNLISSHTESAGFPEQVSNDKNHQYFEPPTTDTYRFVIYNDPEDSRGTQEAVFMIIEHLEMNKRYELYLEGRPSPSEPYPPDYVWAYEFSTPNENFQLHVEVPDPDPKKKDHGLDMYEIRLFPMANPSAEVGYYISGVGVPEGNLLQGGVEGQYGLYNTSISGNSFPDLRASCEYAGEDMDVVFGKPQHNETELVLETREVFYYMAMLAEYYHGTISFYIKTDYRQINVTIIESPEVGVTGEDHRVVAELQSPGVITRAWLNYTTDGWRTEEKIQLTEEFGLYEGWLPRFELLDNVQYRIYVEDEIDNSGMSELGFIVLDPVNLRIGAKRLDVNGGESIEIGGKAVESSEINLRIQSNDFEENININVDDEKNWSYMFTPQKEGNYNAKVFFDGDDTHDKAESKEITLSMEKQTPTINYAINPRQVKRTREFEVSGTISPHISGISVKLLCITQTTSYELETITMSDGSFSFFVVPEESGTWQVLPQISESNFQEGTQGEIKVFDVIELTMKEKVTAAILPFTVLPMILAPVGLAVAGLGLGEMRTGFVRGLFGKESGKEDPDEKDGDKKTVPKGAVSYRRRSSR